MRVLIIGAGGHAQVVADILQCQATQGQPITPIGYVDDNEMLTGKHYIDLPVLGSLTDIARLQFDKLIVAIGSNSTRRTLFARYAQTGYQFYTAIHPTATIARDVEIGIGSMICAGVIVNTGSVIGDNVILNTGVTIDHHNKISSHTHIAPGVHLGGDVWVGERSLVGIGATILPQRKIGENVIIGGGAVVIEDVPAEKTVVGIPAKPLNEKSDE